MTKLCLIGSQHNLKLNCPCTRTNCAVKVSRDLPHLPLHLSSIDISAMASRRLALNLNQAVRSRAAIKAIQPIKRGFATPIHQSINTESTTLSNGLTVHSGFFVVPKFIQLTWLTDCNRTFSMGANLNRW